MKFFTKEKPTRNSGDQDNATVSSPENETNAEASCESASSDAAKSVPSSPKIPIAILAQALEIKGLSGEYPGDYFLRDGSLCEEETKFWGIINEKASAILRQISAAAKISESTESESETGTLSLDMHLETYITRDQMAAYGCLIPPIGDGKSLTFEEVMSEVKNAGIAYGINDDLLKELVESGTVLKVFTISEGKPLRDGEDGKIIELYPREKAISFEANENDMVDYKNLNWLQTIHSGETICTIVPPVPGEDGFNVRGVMLKAHEAKTPKLLSGKNTVENEDHTALIAACDGQLIYLGGCFKVEQMIKIDADVDNSVGNLDVIGSITVNGNVFDGFTLKASGDIVVRGVVEGATLIAGGNIQIFQGINGSYKGKLEAGNNVTSRYLENCYVSAGGIVKSDSILNSTVVSSDKVIVVTGKGIILGSTIIAFKGIEAKMIGNEQNNLTNITIGSDPLLYDELRTLRTEVQELSRKTEANDKNIQYLQNQESLGPEYQQLLNKLTLDQSIFNLNLAKKSSRITAIEEELSNGDSCQIVVNQLYPPVKVTIDSSHLTISDEARMCRIYKSEGEIVIGAK